MGTSDHSSKFHQKCPSFTQTDKFNITLALKIRNGIIPSIPSVGSDFRLKSWVNWVNLFEHNINMELHF